MDKESMSVRLRRLSNDTRFVFLACAVLGAVCFLCVYGVRVLNFKYTAWLMTGGDLTQHYTGWLFFRNSAWHFPIGLMDNIIYPLKVSIIFTDSIPLLAIPFKLLSPILPVNFQYFGLFGILCFFLQGGVAGVLIKRLSKSFVYSVVGALFFILSSTMICGVFGQPSLSAHFIILLCIYVCVTKNDKPRTARKNIAVWGGLLCLASMIHLYIVVMIIIFMVFYLLDDCIKTKKVVKPCLEALACTVMLVFVMYVTGAFYGNISPYGGGLGYYSANMLSLFNPAGTSAFLKNLPLATGGQYEGYGYLGLGIILGIVLVIAAGVKRFEEIKTLLRTRPGFIRTLVLAVLLLLAFFLLAFSPRVTFGSHTLFTLKLPMLINAAWGTFRATGRFIWVPAYLVMASVIWAIRKEYKRAAVVILALLLVVQMVDMGGYINKISSRFTAQISLQTNFASAAWDDIGSNFKHVEFLDPSLSVPFTSKEYSFAALAYEHHLTTNDYYLARTPSKSIQHYKDLQLQNLRKGVVDPDTIYVFARGQEANYLHSRKLNLFNIDGVLIGLDSGFRFSDSHIQPLNRTNRVKILKGGEN